MATHRQMRNANDDPPPAEGANVMAVELGEVGESILTAENLQVKAIGGPRRIVAGAPTPNSCLGAFRLELLFNRKPVLEF